MEENEQSLSDTLEWAVGFAIRRCWWIFLPAFCVAVASIVVLRQLPTRYTSEVTLVVDQQQVSPLYVSPLNMVSAADAVRSLTREVLSRPRLLRIIEELGLYPEARRSDALADRMRASIEVGPLDARDYGTFEIAFSAGSPHLAQAVTSRLASLFIEENLRTRSQLAATTATFLADELEEARGKLAEQEERLKNFKLRNRGRLPEEQQAILAALGALRAQLLNTTSALTRSRQVRGSLDTVLTASLVRLEKEKSELLARVTPQHPDVLKKEQEIAWTKALVEVLWGKTSATGLQLATVPPDDAAFAQLRVQVETNADETATLVAEEKRLKEEMTQYEKRLNLMPVTAQELAGILRDYEQYNEDYSELLNKKLEAQLAASLEESEGQRFRLVDPPSLPSAPSSPDSLQVLLGGTFGGIALGFALAFVVEMRDSSFHTEKELKLSYPLPLVTGIPLLLTPQEERTRRLKRILGWLAASVMTLGVLAAEVYYISFA